MAPTTKNKATWNMHTIIIFCNVCIIAIYKNMRPGTHFNAQGWKFIIENFHQLTRLSYDKLQLKNKWDQLKADWKLWKELKDRKTGLGWNTRLDTVDATPDWWATKIAINKEYAKFQKKGLHPDIEKKNDVMFGQTVASGNSCYAARVEDAIGEDNAAEYVSQEVEPITPVSQPSSIPSSSRKTVRSTSSTNLKNDINRLADCVERRLDEPEQHYAECMNELNDLLRIHHGGRLYYFASTLLEQKSKRIAFKQMPTPEEKLGWLNYHYEEAHK